MAVRITVFKPKNKPNFVCQWVDPITGKKQTRSTRTNIRRDAERFAGNLQQDIENGQAYREAHMTPDELCELYIEKYASRKSKHHQECTRNAFNKLKALVNPKLVTYITTAVIDEFRAAMEEKGLSPATVACYLKYLRIVFRWAKRKKYIRNVPDFEMPSGAIQSKGRPVTAEEFERMLAACDKEHSDHSDSWKFLLRGLWFSGLRISEAMNLSWDAVSDFRMEFDGKRPMFWIAAHLNKSRVDKRFPMAPEFYELLMTVPEDQRIGYVFNPVLDNGRKRANKHRTMKGLGAVGKAANIVTKRTESGKTVFASGHDMRRSFGYRWASKVMPAVLKTMMRHGSIETTMKYYVDNSRDQFADAIWGTTEKHEPRDTFSDTTSTDSAYKAQKQKNP